MVTVKYERYHNDYKRHMESKTFSDLENVADWMFSQARGSYKESLYFVDPDTNHEYDGKLRLDSSCISTQGYDAEGYATWVHLIEKDGKIIYSTGHLTNGICHWNDEIKQWLRGCRERRMNPQFNFG